MSFVALIILGIPLLSLAWWMWADRRLRRMGTSRGLRLLMSLAVLLLLIGFTWVLLGRRDVVTRQIPAALYALVLLWGLISLPLLGIPTMLAWSVGSLGKQISQRLRPGNPKLPATGRQWTRRDWLAATVVGLPVSATYAMAAFHIPRITRFRVREMEILLEDLPAALDGIRIAHVTDTHVGKFTRGRVLDEIAATTNSLDADLVLFTGDLIDNTLRDLPAAVAMLQKMRAKSGVFLVEGNHDLFDDPAGFEKGVRDAGLALLRNQAATVQVRGVPVQILGTVWNHGELAMARDVSAVATLRDFEAFPILLSHHPHAFERAAEHGFPLTLAGHTHGGQLMLTADTGAGPAMFRYWSGLYQKAGCALVVSNGTGNWFPMRMNAPAEIIHLTLRRLA